MKIPKQVWFVLAALALSQLMCSFSTALETYVYAYEDVNRNGIQDRGEPFIAGAQVSVDGTSPLTTNAGGWVVHRQVTSSPTECEQISNAKNVVVVSVPEGYEFTKSYITDFHCHTTYGMFSEEEDFRIALFGLIPATTVTGTAQPDSAASTVEESPQPTEPPVVTSTNVPALSITASASPSSYKGTGTKVEFSYTFTNTGNVPLEGPFTLTDLYSDLASVKCSEYLSTAKLDPGKSITCTGTHVTNDTDVQLGFLGNVITVEVQYTDPQTNAVTKVTASANAASVYVAPPQKPEEPPAPTEPPVEVSPDAPPE